ncbi:MAG: glycine--tRNA ligase subunit beta [Desulfobacteraceae bacterium]|nr:MAG: glycine--tRNA ligase subunit beta [Desulfobacteraceae bacterium]
MSTLLIEIGAEEIPAGYIVPALEAFSASMIKAMDAHRIDHGEARILGTPRRLTLMVQDVADTQNAQTSTLTGPPEKVGFDDNGKPTIAAEKFADKAGVPVDQITVEDTGKGRYLTAVVEEKCESSAAILERILPDQILGMPFPKSMRWGDLSITFARPIISLTGMLGTTSLDFTVGNVKSSPFIFGHRFMSPGKVKVDHPDNYESILESANVIVDIDKRKSMLSKLLDELSQSQSAHIIEDEELLDTVNNLVEYPYPVVGHFDKEFLEVPQSVLITAMREHQKYFAMVDENDKLMPMFIAVNNTKARDEQLVARGHEKVLRARLSDAKFFWEQDCQSTLDDFAEKLKKVTFQEKLGSVYEKQTRIDKLGQYLVSVAPYPEKDALSTQVARASRICKSDLVSQVVIEFTKLQGVIGRSYAQNANEDPAVADAIEEHYRPVQSGGALPSNPCSSLVAIADKMDTICGCFSVGLIPTGGADPYALRRQGIGILLIMMDQNLELSLDSLIEQGLMPFVSDEATRAQVTQDVSVFLKNRLVNILTEAGHSKDAVNSVTAVGYQDIPDVLLRVKALDALRKEADFEPLAVTFKRVGNILKKAAPGAKIPVNTDLFEDDTENQLFALCHEVGQTVSDLSAKGDYDTALKHVASLRPKVDEFFDGVMVMAEEENVRNNRIALLQGVAQLFEHIADFTKI